VAPTLVTGATGFVGGHVVHAIRAADEDVRAIVRDPAKAERLRAWDVELVEGDMTDAASLERAVAGCEAVVHLVAIRQGRREQFQEIMVDGTRALLSAAAAADVRRFVLMSALGTTESTRTLVPYFGAKWEMEQQVQQSGIPYVIFRPSFIFARDGGILPTFVKLARFAPVTPIIGSGTQRIQPIWVDDVAEYFADSLGKEEATGRTFELGGPDAVTWNDFWERLKRVRRMRRPSVHVPVKLMRPAALVAERLPGDVPLTNDLLTMLEHVDNVVTDTTAVDTFRLPLVRLDEQIRRAV
jgi:NADH dehydrogenase